MRKRIFILSICLSLCLAGCGQNKYEEYDFLLEMLEEGEYDEAHEVINRLSDGEDWVRPEQVRGGSESDSQTEPEVDDEWPVSGDTSAMVKLSASTLALELGQETELTAKTTNADSSPVWKSSDDTVVTVSDGKLEARAKGTAIITVTVGDASDTCQVTVSNATISTAEEFFAMKDRKEWVYEVVADIDFAGYDQTVETFSGTLEGNGHKFYNIEKGYLFDNNYGTIRDLTLECNISIDTSDNENGCSVTVLAEDNYGTIERCISMGNIQLVGMYANATGLVRVNDGTIFQCGNETNISITGKGKNLLGYEQTGAKGYIGGICSYNGGLVEQCYNKGNFHGEGFNYLSMAGIVVDGMSDIVNCYNQGNISHDLDITYAGDDFAAGICSSMNVGKMLNCINVGAAKEGLCGYPGAYYIDCYYLDSAPQGAICDYYLNAEDEASSERMRVYAISEAQAKDKNTYTALDFDTVWKMSANGYPCLAWED